MRNGTFVIAALLAVSSIGLAGQASAQELVTNGGFELPAISNNSFVYTNSVPGWSLAAGSTGTAIEIQNHVAGSPFEGNQFAELDSNGVTGIFQDLSTTPGQHYTLLFAFSPRPGVAQNILHLSWNGGLVDTLTASGVGNPDTLWTVHQYDLVATGVSTRLQFDDLNEFNDTLGTYVDAVSVKAVPEPGAMALLAGMGVTGSLFAVRRLRRRKK